MLAAARTVDDARVLILTAAARTRPRIYANSGCAPGPADHRAKRRAVWANEAVVRAWAQPFLRATMTLCTEMRERRSSRSTVMSWLLSTSLARSRVVQPSRLVTGLMIAAAK